MIKNNIVLAFRNFRKNKFFTLLNILGLSIGIATALLSSLFVISELSYDRFHEKSDRIYRIAVDALSGNTVIHQTYTAAPYSAALYNDFAEIEACCRICRNGLGSQITVGNDRYLENNILLADTTFFDLFSAEFVYGASGHAALAPNMAVLTRSTAEKYFGKENPVGRHIQLDNETNLQVTAVVEDFPANSHFHFDMLVSLLSFEELYNNTNWFSNRYQNYILLHKNQDYKLLESKFRSFVDKYLYDGHYAEAEQNGNKWELYFQPLEKIHLTSHLRGELEPNGNMAYIYIFGLVALFVLIIACINYINLSTAKSALRSKEIGIRKCLGSTRRMIIQQFFSESLIVSVIAMTVALLFVFAGLSGLEKLLHVVITFPPALHSYAVPILLAVTVLIGILSGIYPALVLASYEPLAALRNKLFTGKNRSLSRNALVIVQFAISIILIVGTLIISQQLDFIQNQRLGFDKEHVLVIKNVNTVADHLEPLKNELRKIPGVANIAVSSRIIGDTFVNYGFNAEGFEGGFTLNLTLVDPEYQDVMHFNLVQGRFFSEQFATDTAGVVLNQAAVDLLGWANPLGKAIRTNSDDLPFTVLGVVENFHYETKHSVVQPLALFHMNNRWGWSPRNISVRFQTDDMEGLLGRIQSTWGQVSHGVPLEYTFFDEKYNDLYKNEAQVRQLFIVFSLLAIAIACLGLLGLAAFMVERRTREIGVRKVLGASVPGIAVLLCREFTVWVLAANVVAWPVSWFVMNRWLANFAYRAHICWWIFALSGVLALAVALLTVSWQAIRAATANPVESLRYE